MSHDNVFLQQYLGELSTQAPASGDQPAAPAEPGTHSDHSSPEHRPLHEQPKPQEPHNTTQQSGEAEGQSTGPSGDSEAGASPHVQEGLQQDTGNSDSKTAKHAAKLRSQDLQEKNRKAQRRFRERQKVCTVTVVKSRAFMSLIFMQYTCRQAAFKSSYLGPLLVVASAGKCMHYAGHQSTSQRT